MATYHFRAHHQEESAPGTENPRITFTGELLLYTPATATSEQSWSTIRDNATAYVFSTHYETYHEFMRETELGRSGLFPVYENDKRFMHFSHMSAYKELRGAHQVPAPAPAVQITREDWQRLFDRVLLELGAT